MAEDWTTIRDLMSYYYSNMDRIHPSHRPPSIFRPFSKKHGIWIRKDNNTLAILPHGKIKWNGKVISSYNPQVDSVFQEFVNSVRLHTQAQAFPAAPPSPLQQQKRPIRDSHLFKSPLSTLKQESVSHSQKVSVAGQKLPEPLFNPDVENPYQSILSAVKINDPSVGSLWNNLFASVRRTTTLTDQESKLCRKIFIEMSKHQDQASLFLKSLARAMKKHPLVTKRFLTLILPTEHFKRTIHRYRNWFIDYLRYLLTNTSTKKFHQQLSRYVHDSKTKKNIPIVKGQQRIGHILTQLNNRLSVDQPQPDILEKFYIDLYRLIRPIDPSHYPYAASIIYEDMIDRFRKRGDCTENVLMVLHYLRHGFMMQQDDFFQAYRILKDMKGCSLQKELFALTNFLLSEQVE